MAAATVGRWGNCLAVRIPADVAAAARISDGDHVEIDTVDGKIVIRAVAPHLTAEALFAGKSMVQWRAEYANAYDWGLIPDVRSLGGSGGCSARL